MKVEVYAMTKKEIEIPDEKITLLLDEDWCEEHWKEKLELIDEAEKIIKAAYSHGELEYIDGVRDGKTKAVLWLN